MKIIGLKGASKIALYGTTSEINGNIPNNERRETAKISPKSEYFKNLTNCILD